MRLFLVTHLVGPLAQLVEQLTFNQRVAGSNPARLTTLPLLLVKLANASCGHRIALYHLGQRSLCVVRGAS